MAGRGGGWSLAPAGQSLLLIVGGLARKPAVVEERAEPRDLLSLTVAFDHDVVDGAPAARFVHRLVELIESGYGLETFHTPSPSGSASPDDSSDRSPVGSRSADPVHLVVATVPVGWPAAGRAGPLPLRWWPR
jgi:hypothetical protein